MNPNQEQYTDILHKGGKTYYYDDFDERWHEIPDQGFTKKEIAEAAEVLRQARSNGVEIEDALQAVVEWEDKNESPIRDAEDVNRDEVRAWVAKKRKSTVDPYTGQLVPGSRSQAKKAAKQAFRLRKQAEREYAQRKREEKKNARQNSTPNF